MTTFVSDMFNIISDGDKIVFVRGRGIDRECIVSSGSYLANFRINIEYPMNSHGSRSYRTGVGYSTIDLTLRGGTITHREEPLVMGVDIFEKLSISDYLDVINEKIKRR